MTLKAETRVSTIGHSIGTRLGYKRDAADGGQVGELRSSTFLMEIKILVYHHMHCTSVELEDKRHIFPLLFRHCAGKPPFDGLARCGCTHVIIYISSVRVTETA
jgi:hypothetical protein